MTLVKRVLSDMRTIHTLRVHDMDGSWIGRFSKEEAIEQFGDCKMTGWYSLGNGEADMWIARPVESSEDPSSNDRLTDYIIMKRGYKYSKIFKDAEKASGDIQDFIDELERNDIKYDVYNDKTDAGCTIFYDRNPHAGPVESYKLFSSNRILTPYMFEGEFEDGWYEEAGGYSEQAAIEKLMRLSKKHGDLVWYSGVNDDYYVDGELLYPDGKDIVLYGSSSISYHGRIANYMKDDDDLQSLLSMIQSRLDDDAEIRVFRPKLTVGNYNIEVDVSPRGGYQNTQKWSAKQEEYGRILEEVADELNLPSEVKFGGERIPNSISLLIKKCSKNIRSFKAEPGKGITASSLWDEPEYSDDIFEYIDQRVEDIVCDVNDADWQHRYTGDRFRTRCKSILLKELVKRFGKQKANDDEVLKYIDNAFSGYGEE